MGQLRSSSKHKRRLTCCCFQDQLGWLERRKMTVALIASLVLLSVLFSALLMFKDAKYFQSLRRISFGQQDRHELKQWSSGTVAVVPSKPLSEEDRLLNGLLAPGFAENSCLSRYQSANYLKGLVFKPSSYLVSKLRDYEALYKKCAPFTAAYNISVEQLQSGKQTAPGTSECNYIVWSPLYGLGNRIISLISAFTYALLSNRVLLVDPKMASLFCEPFPEGSWLLPPSFPLASQIKGLDQWSDHNYGNMLKKNTTMTAPPPPFVYLHMHDEYTQHFFCEKAQSFLHKVPWLIMKSDNYVTPFYFKVPSLAKQLENLFPQKEAVFHLMSRYLLHPTNQVWWPATQYYQEYLANADEKIGIQIRTFEQPGKSSTWKSWRNNPLLQHVLDQVINCTLKEDLLPEINHQGSSSPPAKHKRKAILVTSLSPWYADRIRDMYREHPAKTGEIIGVYQPSHEEYQQTEKQDHNIKALTEIYLLSMMDKLVTSAWSTFGYVAQGLGGMKPWILNRPDNPGAPSCSRDISMEPCFHNPAGDRCKDTSLVPPIKSCIDWPWGFKIVDPQI